MTRTTLKKHIGWTNFGDFLLHYGNGYANIRNVMRRDWITVPEKREEEWLNSYQYFLFRRCMFGLEVYSKEELRYISSQKKKRILSVHKHAMHVINIFKQKLLIAKTNEVLYDWMPNSKTINIFIAEASQVDPDFECSMSFESLGVGRLEIAQELVNEKCLPVNFFKLTVNDDPRMIKLRAPQEPLDQK